MVSQLHTRKAKNKDTRGTTGTWSYTNVHIQTWKFTIKNWQEQSKMGWVKKKKKKKADGEGGGIPQEKRCGGEDCLEQKKKSLTYKQGWGGYFCAHFLLSIDDVHLFPLPLVLRRSILNLIPSICKLWMLVTGHFTYFLMI